MSEELSSENAELTTCQNCGVEDPNLVRVDSGLKLTLSQAGETNSPDFVCRKCLKKLKKSASHGAHLMAKEEAHLQHRADLWANRIRLVKQGRQLMMRGDYADAAITYEKYLKIVALVTEKEKKSLDPKEFNDRPKEITIIASVLWDLMLIYDAHVKFVDKQMETATLLARFLRFSPVYNSIIRKAELEARKARNPQAFRQLLKLCDAQATRCFIANSAFQSRAHPVVIDLCAFRDQTLKTNPFGRKIVAFYYKHSPRVASRLDRMPLLRCVLREVLRGVAFVLKLIFPLPDRRDS